ncbi:MAG: sigma-54-dependent Fis family transcriptional regulator [Myxococcota bacterium]
MSGDLPAARDIQDSWRRSQTAGVRPELRSAPLVLDRDGLFASRAQCDWVPLAESVLQPQLEFVQRSGHVLTLFDARGLMLFSAGDPFVLEKLEDIHFIPGADWSEGSAGTNGPGTALAARRPVHVVGEQHFCDAWRPWHCAAVPLHGPDGEVLGALDLSGPAPRAEPRALQLARALGVSVEQALLARCWQRQAMVLLRYGELAARYSGDLLVAIDCEGQVLQASSAAKARGLPARLRLPKGVSGISFAPPQAPWLEGAAVHPVFDGSVRVGACLVVREQRRVVRRSSAGPAVRFRFEDVVGEGLRGAVSLARSASVTPMPVLLLGESGVGKELLAQAIHAESPRRDGPFVAVNCGALPRELVESELFGYVGGAFSGARSTGAIGRLEAAQGGTLFLDEVGELPLPAQAALLRALQEKVITPVGSAESRAVDFRIVAATNRKLEDAVKTGTFRLDLLHRLNVIAVEVPPLRERLQDLPLLLEHLGALIEHETGLPVRLTAEVRDALARHPWPGNVRELENVLRRLAVLGRERPVTVADLPFSTAPQASGGHGEARRLLDVIHSAKNMADAAARLGVNRSTLYRQLERLGLRAARTARPS